MRVLKKKVQKEGIVKELKLRQFYRNHLKLKEKKKAKNYKKKQVLKTIRKNMAS